MKQRSIALECERRKNEGAKSETKITFFFFLAFLTQNVTQDFNRFCRDLKKLNKGAARQFLLCRFTELHSDASQMADEQDALKTVAHPQ